MEKEPASIPFFAHENSMMHLSQSNKRLLIALVTVCVTFVITILVFVLGYTEREKNWLNTISSMNRTEVSDGIHEQPDP